MASDKTMNETLAAVTPLREAGFAIHWLHPREKRPIGDRWQEKPVASLEALIASFRPGYNVGLRTGEPSRVGDFYAHVVDMDIRVPELAEEAWSALRELLPVDPDTLPMVASGSGGASCHLHLLTQKPFNSKKLATSEGKHRGADGKWHFDWEIEFYGTGKQVALPPSIHPISGKAYRWVREFDMFELMMGDGPIIDADALAALGAVDDTAFAYESREPLDFKQGQMERELALIPVSNLDYDDWLRLGQALHHQLGGTQEGFDLWLEHSRRSERHDPAYERTMRKKYRSFGRYRGTPVTMATIRTWAQEARIAALVDEYDDVDEFPDEPAAAAPAATEAGDFDDMFGDDDDDAFDLDDFDPNCEAETAAEQAGLAWISLMDINDDGGYRATLHNLRLIVENDVRTRGVTAFNEFTQEVVQRGVPGVRAPKRKNQAKPFVQLEGTSWAMLDPVNGDFWTEDKDNAIRAVIEAPKTQGGYGFKVPDRDLRAAIDIVGRKQSFHPVREYLAAQKWDGTPRVERLFIDYLGAPDDAYHRAVARIMMVAAVTRVHEPGAKFDTAVILEGLQGKRKSTFIAILAKNWFVEIDGDVTDTKAMVELLQGAWIAELNELGGFAKADVRHIKAFISRRSDKVRLAYAKRAQEYHRQSIFIGSTNDDVYLKDATGGRRFLPVRCAIEGAIDTDRLAAEIDQLWAEALVIYRQMRERQPRGTLPLYLADAEASEIAERLQESRRVESSEDALAGQIEAWLSKPILTGSYDEDHGPDGSARYRNEVCLLELWCDCLGREAAQYTGAWPSTLGRAMRMVPGWSESTRKPRFGKYGQQRAFERDGWVAKELGISD